MTAKIVTKSTILLGDGKDTVTFEEGVKLKGDTKIKVGSGVDSIEVPEEVSGKGKIFISNFGKRDKIFVDGEKMSGNKLYSGKKEAPDFIAVRVRIRRRIRSLINFKKKDPPSGGSFFCDHHSIELSGCATAQAVDRALHLARNGCRLE